MPNPWLSIPLDDYEGHMKSAEVQQLGALSDLFAEALDDCRPASVAVLGIAGGNGLDRIDGSITGRVVGLDVNPLYLNAVRQRYAFMPGLELCCVDLADQVPRFEPVQLVHAALVFEHAGTGRCMDNAVSLVAPSGALSVVLQLPSESAQPVGASSFASLRTLGSHFSFISPIRLQQTLAERGLGLVREARHALPGGKGFWMGIFKRVRTE